MVNPSFHLGLLVSEPMQCAQAGQEAILAASRDHKPGQAFQALSQRSIRNVKGTLSVMRSRDGIFTDCRSEECTIVHPLGLNKFELTSQVGTHEHKHQSPIHSIIFQYALWQLGTVRRSTPNHAVDATARFLGGPPVVGEGIHPSVRQMSEANFRGAIQTVNGLRRR